MFEIINNTDDIIENFNVINDYIEFLVKKRQIENALFNIIFVTSDEIHKINKEYRNVDRVTDVISFALEDAPDVEFLLYRMLGDIYICLDKVYEQAELYNHSILRETCFLITHGLLHLLGYDHMEENDEKIMFSLQEELLNEYGIKR